MARIEERQYDNIVKHNSNSNSRKFNNSSSSSSSSSADFLSQLDQSLSYSIEKDVDYGYGNIDAIWHISLHPSLPSSKFGFVKIQSQREKGGTADQDEKDNQYSFRKIEEAIGRGIRSGCDKVFLVADNEEMAKSVSGRIEWLSSFGSIVRFDAVSIGISPNQHKPSGSIPSQQRVPKGEKIRKEEMRKREAKFDKYNRPKGERAKEQESKDKRLEREIKLDENSKPKGQRSKEYDV
jgi:hypothetical protein